MAEEEERAEGFLGGKPLRWKGNPLGVVEGDADDWDAEEGEDVEEVEEGEETFLGGNPLR